MVHALTVLKSLFTLPKTKQIGENDFESLLQKQLQKTVKIAFLADMSIIALFALIVLILIQLS